jgi:hypothetical protein
VRPEDKDARQDQRAFASGATLAELEQYIACLRSLGAPDDAHPKVGVNDNYEITAMICVVERRTPLLSQVRPGALERARRAGFGHTRAWRLPATLARRDAFTVAWHRTCRARAGQPGGV